MAQITWRNVDAPNFSGALEGYRQFANMFGAGTQGISDALGAYRTDQARQNDQAILADALQYRTAPAIDEALSSGRLLNGRTPTAAASARLFENASNLVRDDSGRIGNTRDVANFDRSQRDLAAADLLRPVAAELAANPTAAARAEIIRRNQGVLAGATPAQQFDLLTGSRGAEAGNNANALGTAQTNAALRSDRDAQLAQAAIVDATRRGANLDPTTALAYAEQSNLPPGARAIFMQAFPAAYGGGAVGGAPGVPGSAGGINPGATAGTGSMAIPPGQGAAGTRQGSGWDMTVGGIATPKPLTQMTMGEVQEFGKNTLIPGNRGQFGNAPGLGSSASGAFQITGQTLEDFAPKVLGENWKSQPFTPQNQEAVAKAIFESRKGGNLKDTWSSLPDTRPGAYKDVSWDQMRGLITQGEVGGTLGPAGISAPQQPAVDPFTARANTQQLQNLQAQASVGSIAERGMQDNAGSVASKYVSAAQRIDADAGTIADELRSGPFKGTSRQFLLGQINKIVQEGKVNPALAGEIMRQNIVASNKGGFFGTNIADVVPNRLLGNTVNLGNGQRLNDDGIKATIQQLRQDNSPILQQALANTQRQAKIEQVNTARDNMQKAQDAVTMWSQRVNIQPGARDSLARAQAALSQATAAFNAVRAETLIDPNYNPTGRKAPVSVSTPEAEQAMYRAMGAVW